METQHCLDVPVDASTSMSLFSSPSLGTLTCSQSSFVAQDALPLDSPANFLPIFLVEPYSLPTFVAQDALPVGFPEHHSFPFILDIGSPSSLQGSIFRGDPTLFGRSCRCLHFYVAVLLAQFGDP